MRFLRLGVLIGMAACGSGPSLAVQPVWGTQQGQAVRVVGTLQRVRLQNINKAAGRFTYNVELIIAHDGLDDSPHAGDREPGSYRVIVAKIYWEQLDADAQRELAPTGPQHEMNISRWQDYVVGEPISLDVISTSSGHGQRALTRSTSPG